MSIKMSYMNSKIIGIQFSIMSPDEIRRASVAEITSKDTYINNKPCIGGLFDPRMGVLEPGMLCPTDGLTYMESPGYPGHIELARPVFYIQYIPTVLKILKCVCFKCSKLLISKEKYKQALDLDNEARWKFVFDIAKDIKACGDDTENGCGCVKPKIKKESGIVSIFAEWKDKETDEPIIIKLTAEMVLKILKRISDEDVHFMGFSPVFSRPDWMICQVLTVPPPTVRPSIKHDAQQRSDDDLTHILVNIIKTNNFLKEKIQNNASDGVIDNMTELVLQYYIATQVDNKIPGVASVAQRSGRPYKSIKDRLNGKGGRMRGNLMAKRVDFSARSVITADPNISIRELGIPMKIAKNITKPVVVNDRNKKFLMKLIQNGPELWPGAKILEKQNGESISLRYFTDRNSIVIENGDIVHRHMMDGDAVLFNRQPTLHRMSMMCHLAKIMKQGDTFRLNVACTAPYNADFDGDEMNLHMPQDIEAEMELRNLAAVNNHLISPAKNSSIIGIFQDSMLGCYQFTRANLNFTPREAMNLLMEIKNLDEKEILNILKENNNKINSFDILSQILPPLSIKYETEAFKKSKEKENYATSNKVIEIKNGKFIRGQIDKKVLAGGTKGLIQRINNDFGNMTASNFIDDLQNIVTKYMVTSSFSVGISDLISNQKTNDEIINVITGKKEEVKNVIEQVQLGIFENNTGKSNLEEFEYQVNNILNQATNESGKIGLNSLDKNNRFVNMVKAGSKGSELNISFMISCLGQQNVDGKRIPYGFDQRTLPHYNKYDDSPSARGFVESSYINGLSPQELFFHAMGGRVGLIDTAVKTSTTGYIQRRLIKGLEDLMVNYDMTIRNNKNKIVQFNYGEDNFDNVKIENQGLSLVEMNIQEIYDHYLLPNDTNPIKTLSNIFLKSVNTKVKKDMPEFIKKANNYIKMMITMKDRIIKNVFNNKDDNMVSLPVSFKYIIDNIKEQMHITSTSLVDITLLEAYEIIESYYNKLDSYYYFAPNDLFKTLYFFHLSPKQLLIVKRFNKAALFLLLDTIIVSYKRAIVSPGEMVGVIAGQSIGEVSTQMTLNSVTYDTLILVRDENKKIERVQIGDFVKMCINTTDKLDYNKNNDTSYAPTMSYYEIPSVSEEGDVVWKQIEAGTQHPVVNKDGTNTLLKITTFEQRTVIATKAKSFLQLVDGKILPVDGDSLKVGQYLPVSLKPIDFEETFELELTKYLPNSNINKILLNEDFAYDIANYCMSTNLKRCLFDNYELILKTLCGSIGNIKLVDEILFSNKNFIDNFVSYLVEIPTFHNSHIKFNHDIQFMIHNATFEVDKMHPFYEWIPNKINEQKVDILNRFDKKNSIKMDELLFDQIISIEEVSNPTDYVYDLTVKDTRNFNIYNGLALRDTFHFAGVASKSNVTRGVPRIEEILSLSTEIKNPSLSIYLHKEDETNKERARNIMYMLEHTKLQELVKNVQLCFDPDDLNTLIIEDKEMIDKYNEFNRLFEECNSTITSVDEAEKSKWIIRLELDHETMLEKNITMDDINFTLVNVYDSQISCIYSDYNSDKLIFRIRLNETIKNSSKNAAKMTLDQSDKIYMLKNFQDQMLNNIVIRGVKNIDKVNLRKIRNNFTEENGRYVKKDIWVLDTIGTNLMDVLSLDYIDNERTFSNDIVEVYKVLGIEAARQMIYNELVDVIEFDGTYINYHNFSVLIDRMTYSHKLISIVRHGINNDNIGPLAKASFEETPEMFLKAARHGEIDNMRGISANVMCGQEGYYGTSAFQVLLNMKEMMNQQESSEYNPVNKDDLLDNFFKEEKEDETIDMCSINNLAIQNNVINIYAENDENDNAYDPGF